MSNAVRPSEAPTMAIRKIAATNRPEYFFINARRRWTSAILCFGATQARRESSGAYPNSCRTLSQVNSHKAARCEQHTKQASVAVFIKSHLGPTLVSHRIIRGNRALLHAYHAAQKP